MKASEEDYKSFLNKTVTPMYGRILRNSKELTELLARYDKLETRQVLRAATIAGFVALTEVVAGSLMEKCVPDFEQAVPLWLEYRRKMAVPVLPVASEHKLCPS